MTKRTHSDTKTDTNTQSVHLTSSYYGGGLLELSFSLPISHWLILKFFFSPSLRNLSVRTQRSSPSLNIRIWNHSLFVFYIGGSKQNAGNFWHLSIIKYFLHSQSESLKWVHSILKLPWNAKRRFEIGVRCQKLPSHYIRGHILWKQTVSNILYLISIPILYSLIPSVLKCLRHFYENFSS